MVKEYLYVGHYIDKNGFYILKIGTTNDLKRRAQEHTRNYKKSLISQCPLMVLLFTIGGVRYRNTILFDTRTETAQNGLRKMSENL